MLWRMAELQWNDNTARPNILTSNKKRIAVRVDCRFLRRQFQAGVCSIYLRLQTWFPQIHVYELMDQMGISRSTQHGPRELVTS